MRRPSNGAPPPGQHDYRASESGSRPDLALYERLIEDGVAAADARRTGIDHVTARRLAIWRAARPQAPVFARSLVEFAETGAISRSLRVQLRIHARSGNYADLPQAARLLHYCADRAADVGPIGANFGAACDQLDRADAMLTDLHDRKRQGHAARTRVARSRRPPQLRGGEPRPAKPDDQLRSRLGHSEHRHVRHCG